MKWVIKYSIKINFAISTYYDSGILDWEGSVMGKYGHMMLVGLS